MDGREQSTSADHFQAVDERGMEKRWMKQLGMEEAGAVEKRAEAVCSAKSQSTPEYIERSLLDPGAMCTSLTPPKSDPPWLPI